MRMHCDCAKPQPGLALVHGGLSFLCAATGPDRPAQNSMDERSVRPLTSSCPCSAALRRLSSAPPGARRPLTVPSTVSRSSSAFLQHRPCAVDPAVASVSPRTDSALGQPRTCGVQQRPSVVHYNALQVTGPGALSVRVPASTVRRLRCALRTAFVLAGGRRYAEWKLEPRIFAALDAVLPVRV
jgi:hypothetical protein